MTSVIGILAHNQKMHAAGTFGDLVKAFDCVNHTMLLAKLHLHVIRGVS
jgi:hypothetical protein